MQPHDVLPEEYQWIVAQFEPDDDNAWQLFAIARKLERDGNLEGAASVYDRAYGLEPREADIIEARAHVLDQLAVTDHDLAFRYVPGGVFLMGRDSGEADEGPWHPVWLSPYWMSETPVSWASYCRMMGWMDPPNAMPRQEEGGATGSGNTHFFLHEETKIRLQYCEDLTLRALDWHSHYPSADQSFAPPPRSDRNAPWTYEEKPMVAVSWQSVEELGERLSSSKFRYSLPSEAQWEKAARGGLIGARCPWGDDPPTNEICDFERFHEFSIRASRTFPPNGYGLYAMSGGVWEWTSDWYDHDYYGAAGVTNPTGPEHGEEKVLRGGSWADCAEAVTVTCRMSRDSKSWRDQEWGRHLSPTLGFRLCRTRTDHDT